MSAPPLVRFPPRLGAFKLVERLGAGSMGTVFRAELAEDRPYASRGARVAVKVLHPWLLEGEGHLDRFQREAAVGQSIEHPGVVRTLEAGRSDDNRGGHPFHYLALEFVEGRTLLDLIGELKRVSEPLLRDLGTQIAQALAAIHAAHAVHRDIKPSNILITSAYQVKLMDLGIAAWGAAGAARLTSTGYFVGTPRYAAPEQFRGERVGPAADLYALGVVLYEAATGVHPFASGSIEGMMRRHLDERPRPLGALDPQLTPFFEEVVARLLEKTPSSRFGSAAELGAVLSQGESSPWWVEREAVLRAADARGEIRRIKVPRETRVVGRAHELEQLRALHAEVRQSRGGLVLIEGEAGVGKTRLVDALVEQLESDGEDLHVLYGASRPTAAAVDRGPLAVAVVNHFGEEGLGRKLAGRLTAPPDQVAAFAARIEGGLPPPGRDPLRPEAAAALYAQLAVALAAERPVVWIVEDLQLGGSETIDLVEALAQVASRARLLLVVTTRPGLGEEALTRLLRLPGAHRILLPRLGAREVMLLLRESFRSQTLAERLGGLVALKSDGNPFFVLELIQKLREDRLVRQIEDGTSVSTAEIAGIDVPSSVKGLLISRLAGLSDDQRAILEAGAVQGFAFDADLVARVLERRRLEVLQALAGIERKSGVVRARGHLFEFDHYQLQEVVYAEIPAPLKAEYHACLADAFVVARGLAGVDPAQVPGAAAVFLAEHLLRGGRDGRGVLPAALDHLQRSNQHEAFLRVSELALAGTKPGDPAWRADLALARADSFRILGRRPEQRLAIESALAAAQEARDPERVAKARLADAQLRLNVGDTGGAEMVLDGLLETLSGAGDPLLAQAKYLKGLARLQSGHADEAELAFEQARALARRAGDRRLLISAAGGLSLASLQRDDYPRAEVAARRYLRLARTGEPRSEAQARGDLGAVLLAIGRPTAALRHFDTQLELSRQTGHRSGERTALVNLGVALQAAGRVQQAREAIERSLAISQWIGRGPVSDALAVVCLAEILHDEGRLDEAERLLEEARAAGGLSPRLEAYLELGLGHVANAREQAAAARRFYDHAHDVFRDLGNLGGIAEARFALGRLLVEQREEDAAALFLTAAEKTVDETTIASPGPLPSAYLALLGRRAPGTVRVPPGVPVRLRAEAHLVLHRAGGPAGHRRKAAALLAKMAAHLDEAGRRRFWESAPLARAFRLAG